MKDLPLQGPYVTVRVGFEPATFWTKVTEPTTEPPCPTDHFVFLIIGLPDNLGHCSFSHFYQLHVKF